MVNIVLEQMQNQLDVAKELLQLAATQQKFLVQEEFDEFLILSKKKNILLTEYRKIESSALLNQIVEDEYDSYSGKKQQEIETLLGNLAEIIDEVVQTDKSNQDYIKETLNHPVLSASEASAADIKATYDVSNHQKSVLGRQYVDRKN
ncbi:hypothetical protein CMK18_06250 [Candidatus Poribacteria bacterium]|nr:hypothetical protein [Candidatus Poribacteria bacterium]